jgi:glycosyltransferase involved in cell wall biosynthesis
MNRLAAVIITYNEEQNLARCLASLQGVADEIVVVDSGSSDRTAEICVAFGCRIFQRVFTGYSDQKQFAVDCASCDWVLSIDADEEVTPELKAEIRDLTKREEIPANGYYLRRDLVYLGRHMRFGGTANERILRLFNRKYGRFNGAIVHEKVNLQGPGGDLKGKLLHFSYRDLPHQMVKISEYSAKAAELLVSKGRRYPKIWVLLKFKLSFFTFYIIKGGFLDGYPGFMWALMRAVYASLKIARTIEINQTARQE